MLCVAAITHLFVACSSTGHTWSSSETKVERIHLLGTPVAVDTDKVPGPDAVGVRVYAASSKSPEAVRLVGGTLELHLFDGSPQGKEGATAAPLKVFTYTVADLKKAEYRTAVGYSYNFLPSWGDRRPKTNRVTVVAVYKAADGTAIRSTPITIPLGKS